MEDKKKNKVNDEPKYKEGTINGMKFNSKHDDDEEEIVVTKEKISTKTLIKIAIFCVIAIVIFLVCYLIIKNTISFNGVYYETPSEDEVIEVVVDPEEEVQEQVNLKLKGELVIEIKKGTKWEDPGYEAVSTTNGDITDYVKVSGEVDVDKVGTYELVYELDYKVIAPKLTRLVKVVGNEPEKPTATKNPQPTNPNKPVVNPPKPSAITLSLIGNDTVYLVTGSTYNDAGAKAVDNLGNNVSNKITRTGSVNTNVAGTYKITYSINNYNGQVLTVVRNVIVQAMNISLTSSLNGSEAKINVVTNVDNFSHILLPNGTKITTSSYTYTVSTNGTYEFVVYNTNGNYRKATITINNIVAKKQPTCSISRDSERNVVINMNTNSSVDHFVYNGVSFTSQFNTKQTKCGNFRVTVVYKDGTTMGISCYC